MAVEGRIAVGPDEGVRVAVPDQLQVDVVAERPLLHMVYRCCRDSFSVIRPCMVSAVIPWRCESSWRSPVRRIAYVVAAVRWCDRSGCLAPAVRRFGQR